MTQVEEIQKKRTEEKETLQQMLQIYCHGQHKTKKGQLCDNCQELLTYASKRTDHCPHMAEKTFCSACPTPCYAPEKQEQIRQIMKYAGPRMLFRAPIKAIRHLNIQMQKRRKTWG